MYLFLLSESAAALSKTIIMTKAKLNASDSEDDEDYVPPAEDGE